MLIKLSVGFLYKTKKLKVDEMIKVRFAPSPTGYLHIGGARTALFNWMYARAQKGIFVLRIEDTDLQRSSKVFVDEILDSMKWLGLDWDELYYQGERFDIYKDYAQKLLNEGKAYESKGAIILKMPKQEVKIYDLIRGEINFDTANFTVRKEDGSTALDEEGKPLLKDEVLMKADGSPSYSFCCVIDDALMEISHVIRGEDHISNTPKQIVMYEALGFKPPKFAHLPLIMGEDGGRLSKRTGAVSVSDYKENGFISEALINYLLLLGWSPGNNQEMITIKNALKTFSIKKVNKAAAVFSMDKLRWLNGQYIKQMEDGKLVELLVPFLIEKNFINSDFDSQNLKSVVKLYKGRLPTLLDFIGRAGFVFADSVLIEEDLYKKYFSVDRKKEFGLLGERLNNTEPFDLKETEEVFRALTGELGIQASDIVHPIRVALTGSDVGPGLFETMVVLGKEKTVKRLTEVFQ